MKTDIEIARSCTLDDIGRIASKLKLEEKHLIRYGNYKAKLPLSLIDENKVKKARLILVWPSPPLRQEKAKRPYL